MQLTASRLAWGRSYCVMAGLIGFEVLYRTARRYGR